MNISHFYFIETHPKHIEAMGGMPSLSSGTTSDDIYVVPDHQESSSQDEQEKVMSDVGHMRYDGDNIGHDDGELKHDIDNMRYDRDYMGHAEDMRYESGYTRHDEGQARYDEGYTRHDEGQARYDEGYMGHNEEHMFHSPINSLNEESLPSGIPGKLKLSEFFICSNSELHIIIDIWLKLNEKFILNIIC
jgi:hypothetical protein